MISYLSLVAAARCRQNEGSLVIQSLAGRLQDGRTAKTRLFDPAAVARAMASRRVRAALKMNRVPSSASKAVPSITRLLFAERSRLVMVIRRKRPCPRIHGAP